MKYQVMGEAPEGSYLIIGVEGSSTIQLNIEYGETELDDIEMYYLDSAKIATFPLNNVENTNILAIFEVNAINIGVF